MPTRRHPASHVRRSRRLLVLATGLVLMLAVGSGLLSGASDPPCKDAAATPRDATAAAVPAGPDAGRDVRTAETLLSPTGLDLRLRVWHYRIEFPWLKALPLRPGRTIIVSLFDVAEP